jgi:hypothetical protein
MVLNDYLANFSIFYSISYLISLDNGTIASSNPWNFVQAAKTISEAPFSKSTFLSSIIVMTDILFLADEKGNYNEISYFFLVYSY